MLTKQVIRQRAKAVHGDKYDYSQADLRNDRGYCCVICPQHGPFWVVPALHYSVKYRQGCNKCSIEVRGKKRRKPVEDYIKQIREIHGSKYDLSRFDEIDRRGRRCIICPEHGEFWVVPAQMVFRKTGCKKCGMRRAGSRNMLPKDKFIEKAVAVHGDKYLYDKLVDYRGVGHMVTFVCPLHGEFSQYAADHLAGRGCSACAAEERGLLQRRSSDWLERARAVHGNKYIYPDLIDPKGKGAIEITCPRHGVFSQALSDHVAGQGCRKCYHDSRRVLPDEWLDRFRAAHGTKYDYSLFSAPKSKRSKCKIICPEHGPFEQRPDQHAAGYGCPKCSASKGEAMIRALLDEFRLQYDEQWPVRLGFRRVVRYDFRVGKTLIEYDGMQHYRSIEFFGGDSTLKKTMRNDKEKDAWAHSNGYDLIRIGYHEWDLAREKLKVLQNRNLSE